MEDPKKGELDCFKKCERVIEDCEASGQSRDQCEDRYNQCISS